MTEIRLCIVRVSRAPIIIIIFSFFISSLVYVLRFAFVQKLITYDVFVLGSLLLLFSLDFLIQNSCLFLFILFFFCNFQYTIFCSCFYRVTHDDQYVMFVYDFVVVVIDSDETSTIRTKNDNVYQTMMICTSLRWVYVWREHTIVGIICEIREGRRKKKVEAMIDVNSLILIHHVTNRIDIYLIFFFFSF